MPQPSEQKSVDKSKAVNEPRKGFKLYPTEEKCAKKFFTSSERGRRGKQPYNGLSDRVVASENRGRHGNLNQSSIAEMVAKDRGHGNQV